MEKEIVRSFDFRILVSEYGNGCYLHICEVYYEDDKPKKYSEEWTLGGYSEKDILFYLNLINSGLKKEKLWYGEKFPEEYNGTYKNGI